jgi:O-antigen ligase
VPVAVVLTASALLASVGGRYSWPLLPALFVATALFLLSGARVAAYSDTRALDVVIVTALALIGVQMVPLPPALLHLISPATFGLQHAFAVSSAPAWRPISIDPSATRRGLLVAVLAAMMFWTSREAFAKGGSRVATRLLAVVGFGCGFVSLAQHATAPHTVLWKWTVSDPRALPFGPFVDRNQLATWLVLTASVVTGALAMHIVGHGPEGMRRTIRLKLVAIVHGTGLAMVGCIGLMLFTLVATLSRSGLVAMVAAAVVGSSLCRRDHRHAAWTGVAAALLLILLAVWVDTEGFAERVMTSVSLTQPAAISRLTIWREALHIISTFPLFGTGVGTFADAMFVYQQGARDVLFNHGHNEYVQISAEGGLVMLAVVVTGVIMLARRARVMLATDTSTYRFVRAGACAGLAAVAVQSIWETGLRAPANLVLVATLAGMALAVRGVSDAETASR